MLKPLYGDGHSASGRKIWELADPCVAAANTEGLSVPNEVKLKYPVDNDFRDLSGEALKDAISPENQGEVVQPGWRHVFPGNHLCTLTDLIGSFCDLTKGIPGTRTPIILVQGLITIPIRSGVNSRFWSVMYGIFQQSLHPQDW